MKQTLLLFIVTVFALNINAQLCFSPKVAYAVGIYPSSLCTADFNADGQTDLAVANRTGTVSILLGTGAGTFDTAAFFHVGYLPYSVCTADFNNDSIADVATGNRGPWNVSILFGNGAGGFGIDSTVGVSNPREVVAADFNRDGKADLAVAHYGAVLLFLGNGMGGFATPVSFSVSSYISAFVTSDFNNDSIPDLATANGGNSNITILLGNGAGGFSLPDTFATGSSPGSIIASDFNNDGYVDIVTGNTANNVAGNVSVLLGMGNGSFGTATHFSIGANSVPHAICSADFTGDGNADLAIAVVAGNSTANVSVLEGNGAGGFGAAVAFAVDSFPNAVRSADFNADGKPDLALVTVFTNNDTGYVDVLLNCTLAGVNNLKPQLNEVQVYPNPGNGVFTIDISSGFEEPATAVEVYNVMGERIYFSSKGISKGTNQIDLRGEPAGIYFAGIHFVSKVITRKIRIE
jgi:hypothetical protein